MENTQLPYKYVDAARKTLTNANNLASYRKDNALVLQYFTQAGDEVNAQVMVWPSKKVTAQIFYTIGDGPRSRTEQDERTAQTLSELLEDLNAEAAV